ncbi:hypothetical protein J2P12_06985, partial [Candidatus Bathyarchaeota archaeon]|nr:hypothetical protein [Candidatus Bathyarchaeota archaeon]
IPQFGSHRKDRSYIPRVIVETLRKSKNGKSFTIADIAQSARTTISEVKTSLASLVNLEDEKPILLSASTRLRLALHAAQLGMIQESSRALTWQEFEVFSEECLSNNGFETRKGLVINDSGRHWQIDIAAERGQILLTLDCKHWESANYSSKFKTAIQHQKQSLHPLARYLEKKGELTNRPIYALPVILTLFEPRESNIDGVVLVSVGQLPDFLEHLTPYSPELPFIPLG